MKQWILLSLLLTFGAWSSESTAVMADTLITSDIVLEEQQIIPDSLRAEKPATAVESTLSPKEAQEVIELIKEKKATKLSFYVGVEKRLKESLTATDIQQKLQEIGIDVPLATIQLEEPIEKPSKKKVKSTKDLEKITLNLGSDKSIDIYIQVIEEVHPDLWAIFFSILGGLAIFLLGMNYMSNGLQTIAGPSLRRMIAAVTNNRLIAVLVGTGVTTLVQSSSVTTVMVVGFVNSGIMTLKQSLGVIFGSNIGTTITGWIIALKIGKYGLPILGVAAIIYLFSRKDKIKYIAMAIMGLGMVFYGLELMKHGFAPFKSIPSFEAVFSSFHIETLTFFDLNMYKAVLVGALLTMIVQSSSATLGITITLAATGVINFYTAAALVMGENIGTTITAILASLNTNRTARRAALGHMIFNVLGVIWITTLFPLYIHFIEFLFANFGSEKPIEAEIALVHTLFNVINVIIFLPFINQIAALLEKILPGEKEKPTLHVTNLHAGTLFESPNLAIEAAKFEIAQMGKLVVKIDAQMQEVLRTDRKKITDAMKQGILDLEEKLDIYQKEISEFLMDLSATKSTSHAEAERIQMLFRHADEYESISDYYANILKKGIKLIEGDIKLPKQEKSDLLEINELLGTLIAHTDVAINENDGTQGEILLKEATAVKVLIKAKRKEHLTRLKNDEMSPLLTVTYLDIITSYRQVYNHLVNMAELL